MENILLFQPYFIVFNLKIFDIFFFSTSYNIAILFKAKINHHMTLNIRVCYHLIVSIVELLFLLFYPIAIDYLTMLEYSLRYRSF